MKKSILFFPMLFLGMFSAQAQITIDAADIPIPGTFNVVSLSATANPASGNNQNWNYSSATATGALTNDYITETDLFWTALGVDVYIMGYKGLTSTLGFDVFSELDKSTTGIIERGINIPAQSFNLSAFTGGATDSLIIPEQNLVYATNKVLMPFPFNSTYSSTYNSARNVVDFTINAPMAGLSNTPCQQVFYEVRKEDVVGWGTMRVYTPGGPSAPVDVLMSKISGYTTDSFYVGGAPASPAIQAAFGVTQGQKSTIRNSYNFYRKGYYNYLLRLYYGADSSFTTITDAWSLTDGVAPLGVSSTPAMSYMTMLYPNPSVQTDIRIRLLQYDAATFTKYTISNVFGQVIFFADATWEGGELVCQTAQLPKGHYILTIHDEKSGETITEKFQMN